MALGEGRRVGKVVRVMRKRIGKTRDDLREGRVRGQRKEKMEKGIERNLRARTSLEDSGGQVAVLYKKGPNHSLKDSALHFHSILITPWTRQHIPPHQSDLSPFFVFTCISDYAVRCSDDAWFISPRESISPFYSVCVCLYSTSPYRLSPPHRAFYQCPPPLVRSPLPTSL